MPKITAPDPDWDRADFLGGNEPETGRCSTCHKTMADDCLMRRGEDPEGVYTCEDCGPQTEPKIKAHPEAVIIEAAGTWGDADPSQAGMGGAR